jgi:hypothetical protein
MSIIDLKVGETTRLELPNPEMNSFTVHTDTNDVVEVVQISGGDPAQLDITAKQPDDTLVTVCVAGNEVQPVWEKLVMVRA